jgi:hypothetical protein
MSVSDIAGTVIGFPLLVLMIGNYLWCLITGPRRPGYPFLLGEPGVGGLAQPRHEEFKPRTAWSLFNCFTEVLKETSFFALPPRTVALNGLLDQYCGVSDLFAPGEN